MIHPTLQDVLERLQQHRCLQRRLRGAGAKHPTNRYEIFSVEGPGNTYSVARTMKFAMKIAEAEAWEYPGTVVSIWSPLRCHVYQAVVHDGQYRVLHDGAAHQQE